MLVKFAAWWIAVCNMFAAPSVAIMTDVFGALNFKSPTHVLTSRVS